MDWIRRTFAPNRLAVYLTTAGGAATAAATVVANTDTSSKVGIMIGYAGAVAAALKFIEGSQKHEARQAVELQGVELATPPPAEPTDVPAAVVAAAKPAAKKAPARKAA